MNILVLYQSRSGHTRRAAESIAQAARDLTQTVHVKSVIEVGIADIENADMLFVGTWVQGLILFGVKPAGAELWVPILPPLEGKPTGVFCTYAFNPRSSLRALSDLLAARGATILGQHAFHRSKPGDGARQFVQSVLESAQPVMA